MKEEIIEHVKNLKHQGDNVRVDENQINDLINKIFDKKDEKDENLKLYIKFFLLNNHDNISISYDGNKLSTEEINSSLQKYINGLFNNSDLVREYNKFIVDSEKLKNAIEKRKKGAGTPNPKKLDDYIEGLIYISHYFSPKGGKGLKVLTSKQMLNRLPILLAQIQTGNNSDKLKNETRQILYSLYRSKVLTKTVYNNLVKSIRA